MKGIKLQRERSIFYYLLSVHLLSYVVVFSLAYFNALSLFALPIIAWVQFREWQRLYCLSDKNAATHFSFYDEGLFDLSHHGVDLGRWQVRSYFRLEGVLFCFLEMHQPQHPIDELRLQSLEKKTFRQTLLQQYFLLKELCSLKVWRSQVVVISEQAIGSINFRKICRVLIWEGCC